VKVKKKKVLAVKLGWNSVVPCSQRIKTAVRFIEVQLHSISRVSKQ